MKKKKGLTISHNNNNIDAMITQKKIDYEI